MKKTKKTSYVCRCEECMPPAAPAPSPVEVENEALKMSHRDLKRQVETLQLANEGLRFLLRKYDGIQGRIDASKDAEWVTGSGEHVRVQAMNGSHLHYAIAKGLRGEYGGGRRLVHLQNEALRRLIQGVH